MDLGQMKGLFGTACTGCDAVVLLLLHVQVDLHRCMKVDERRFTRDYFDLTGNACASLYDNVLALTSVSDWMMMVLTAPDMPFCPASVFH